MVVKVKEHGAALFLIAVFLLIGYHQVFFNHANFLVEEDPVSLFEYNHINAIGNGWHPERGLGISFFFGDPGAFHEWSVFSLVEKIFHHPVMVYNMTVIVMLFFAAFALYYFLYALFPRVDKKACALLALLIIFGPLQYKFYFQRHWISLALGTPLFLPLLYRYLESPSVRGAVLMGLLFWAVLFLGSFAPFIQLLILGFLFYILYVLIKKPNWGQVTLRYVLVHAWIFLIVLLLGAWVFYPIFLEMRLEHYVRDPLYFTGWGKLINLEDLIVTSFQFLHCGLVSSRTALPVAIKPLTFSWFHPSVVSPIVLIFVLCWKPKEFWHIVVKMLYLLFLINDYLLNISPLYNSFLDKISSKGYPLDKFHPIYHPLAIILIAIFIYERMPLKEWQEKLLKLTGYILAFFYVCNFVFLIVLCGFTDKFSHHAQGGFWQYVSIFFAGQMKRNTHWYTFVFFALSAFLCWVFGQYRLLDSLRKKGIVLPLLLAVNGVLLSWSVYPTNTKALVWSGDELASFSRNISPTDRFYMFASSEPKPRDVATFVQRWPLDRNGSVVDLTGSTHPPGLDLSACKSFTQKNVQDYLFYSMNNKINSSRQLVMGPEITSPGLNMAGIKYYYSNHPYDQPQDSLVLIKNRPLWVYENRGAWPYYYLAREIQAADSIQSVKDLRQGAAYVSPGDDFNIPPQTTSTVDMERFSNGEMLFKYFGEKENFLVVADAWHPFWKVQVDSKNVDVIKSNFIFKGVRLPPGEHQVRFYFDTSAYRPGIYVSVVAWLLLLGWVVWGAMKKRRQHGVLSRYTGI